MPVILKRIEERRRPGVRKPIENSSSIAGTGTDHVNDWGVGTNRKDRHHELMVTRPFVVDRSDAVEFSRTETREHVVDSPHFDAERTRGRPPGVERSQAQRGAAI